MQVKCPSCTQAFDAQPGTVSCPSCSATLWVHWDGSATAGPGPQYTVGQTTPRAAPQPRRSDWASAGRYAHPIMGFGFALTTSQYRLPSLVADLALDPEGRGEYVYVSRRPGRMTAPDTLPSLGGHPHELLMTSGANAGSPSAGVWPIG